MRLNLVVETDDMETATKAIEVLSRTCAGLVMEGVEALLMVTPSEEVKHVD